MAYETVQDVLERARTFHRELGAFYQRMEDRATKERVRLLLDYLSRHERYMDECLARYEEGAAKRVLDTWYKYTPNTVTLECFKNADLQPDMSVEDVIRTALRLDDGLVELYKGMAENAVSTEVRDLFIELLELEKKEEHQMVRDAIEMTDL